MASKKLTNRCAVSTVGDSDADGTITFSGTGAPFTADGDEVPSFEVSVGDAPTSDDAGSA